MPKPYRQQKNDINKRALKANPKAHRISLRELESIWNHYEGKCAICGQANPELVTFDHVMPLDLGGTNEIDNFGLLCESDNKGKGDKYIGDYRPKDKPILKRASKKGVSTTYRGGYCQATTKGGKPCSAYAIEGSQFCFTHDPTREAERAEAHKRGGESRPRPTNDAPFPNVDVKTANGLLFMMEDLFKDTWTLETSVARSRTIGYLAQVQKGILEVGELEDRVKRLEELAAHGQPGKKN